MLEITPVNLEQANAFVAALTSRSMELTSYTVSDEDERAWCIVCGAEFCPNGRYADSDDQAEMCEGCESVSASRKALRYNIETPKPGVSAPGSDLLPQPRQQVMETMLHDSTTPRFFRVRLSEWTAQDLRNAYDAWIAARVGGVA